MKTWHAKLEVMERDGRYALSHHDELFKIAVREKQRQAIDAVNQVVRESSES